VTPGTVPVPPCHRYIPRRHITPDATEELKLDGYRIEAIWRTLAASTATVETSAIRPGAPLGWSWEIWKLRSQILQGGSACRSPLIVFRERDLSDSARSQELALILIFWAGFRKAGKHGRRVLMIAAEVLPSGDYQTLD
jgi:hypothetical protein